MGKISLEYKERTVNEKKQALKTPNKRNIGAMGGYIILIALDDSRIRYEAVNADGRSCLFENIGDLMNFVEILGEMIRWESMSTRLN